MTCSVDRCDGSIYTRSVCLKHYTAARRAGTDHLLPRRAPRSCQAEGCDRRHFCKGYCTLHYQRMRVYGTPEPREAPTLADRLAALTERTETCWLWRGASAKNGYGRISVNDQLRYAHRVAYEHHVGPIPDGLTIDHLCMNRMCVNPDHLEPVTRAENTRRELRVRYSEKASA